MKVAALILTMFLAAVSAAGQVVSLKNDIPESQYLAATKAASETSKKKVRRIATRETLAIGTTTRIIDRIDEYLPPHRHRMSQTRSDGPVTFISEAILIKHMYYVRLGSDPWYKMDMRNIALPYAIPYEQGDTSGKRNEYSVVADVLNGEQVQLFEHKHFDSQHGFFRESKKWIGKDGLVYREEEVSGTVSPRFEGAKVTSTHTYNPSPAISIKAPMK